MLNFYTIVWCVFVFFFWLLHLPSVYITVASLLFCVDAPSLCSSFPIVAVQNALLLILLFLITLLFIQNKIYDYAVG